MSHIEMINKALEGYMPESEDIVSRAMRYSVENGGKRISPELLKIIAEMGHGDELVLADANFPGTSIGQKCVRCDGHGCAEVMRALLTLFPLDDFVEAPLAVMQVPSGMFPGDKAPIWEAFRAAADTDLPTAKFDMMAHDAFMERAKKAFAVVQTGETALYGNIIIRKGVVRA